MNSVILKRSLEGNDLNDWVDLEHRLWQELKDKNLHGKKFLVALSGGVDSLALLLSLQRVLKTNVEACFIHHGPGANVLYRDQAQKFCADLCARFSLPFHERKNSGEMLNSEADMRDFRHLRLEEVRVETGCDFIAFGHHREDLLESRLLRLIRGTGLQGLIAMTELDRTLFRPFLKISKKNLQEYLERAGESGFEDPSNADLEPLRNWLRQSWLVDLEKRQPGALQSLARSLELLVDAPKQEDHFKGFFIANELSRSKFLSLTKTQQKQLLAKWLLSLKVKDFTQAQLEEVTKRLDNSQKEFTFRVAGLTWSVNAQQIR
ncbi:MAG: tRNA lysidine(34) synthetase TilS, partial [Bdellovibrionaceae bacterium]|nr:tRNA lysidine(34) synthetase TilS [Pseudobdellovibrionaceae bacterium]